MAAKNIINVISWAAATVEELMLEGRWPVELPQVGGQERWLRVPGCNSGGAAERSNPSSEIRGGAREELPHA